MGIGDFLLGKPVKIRDPKLGELSTRVKNDNPSIVYSWTSNHQLPGQKIETLFILKGTNTGPFKDQLKAAYRIVDTIPEILISIGLQTKSVKGDLTKMYYLASVISDDDSNKKSSCKFEVNFVSIRNEGDCIDLNWESDKISDIEVY